ncbi:MAG: J domain-containing protein [Anaerolineales bacterium]|jgi:tetratricopeptide (TPR) repeat protein
MFKGRRGSLKRALEQAGDEELRELEEEVSLRQERVAQLEFELADTHADLSRFESTYETKLGPFEDRIEELKADLEQARIRSARRAQWGDRLDEEEQPVDVLEQFRRTWTPREKPPEPPPVPEVDEASKEEMKTIFRALAKRFHPDLVTDTKIKLWRQEIMAQINEAYAAQDMSALRKFMERPDRPEEKVEKTREQRIAELYKEARRLDQVIRDLERTLKELINSHTVRLMLEVSIAAQQGRDLLQEMADVMRSDIAQMEAELASLG